MSNEQSGICFSCGSQILANNFGRQDSCLKCGRDTHACKNCFFYDKAYNNECRETQADRVVEKERSNFCDYFRPSQNATAVTDAKSAALLAAEALFKK